MIIVNSGLMQDDLKEFVLSLEDIKLEFVKKEGLKMYFNADKDDMDGVAIVKSAIKANPKFAGVYFNIAHE